MKGSVYTCTTLHAAAERFEEELPFQIAIVELEDGERVTLRMRGGVVAIGDAVVVAEDGHCRRTE